MRVSTPLNWNCCGIVRSLWRDGYGVVPSNRLYVVAVGSCHARVFIQRREKVKQRAEIVLVRRIYLYLNSRRTSLAAT
jgi:hypothetical protein